jgi:hypothetical protein
VTVITEGGGSRKNRMPAIHDAQADHDQGCVWLPQTTPRMPRLVGASAQVARRPLTRP